MADISERELGRLEQQLESVLKNHDAVLAAQKDISQKLEHDSKVAITIKADFKAIIADVERNTGDLKSFKTFVYEKIQPKLEELVKLSAVVKSNQELLVQIQPKINDAVTEIVQLETGIVDNKDAVAALKPTVSGLKTYTDKLEGSISVWKWILTPLALLLSVSSLIVSIIKMVRG